jgi:hypothetical protein
LIYTARVIGSKERDQRHEGGEKEADDGGEQMKAWRRFVCSEGRGEGRRGGQEEVEEGKE